MAQAAFGCVARDWVFCALASQDICLQMLEHLILGCESRQGPAEKQMVIKIEKQSFSLGCSCVHVALHRGLTPIV